jgi:hypothetical protein
MQSNHSIPEINRLSIVVAAIMLAFALTHMVIFPARLLSFNLFGILIEFLIDFGTLVNLLTAILAASGMDWLLHSHPEHQRYQKRWEFIRHWILPVLTTLVLGVALRSSAGSMYWWVIFVMGNLLLIAVFIAEYNVVNVDDVRHPLAVVGLTSLSFALFLLLAMAIDSANLRLYSRLPLLGVGLMMVISRALFLRLGKWHQVWAIIISLIILEMAVGFHYLPLSPIQYGALLVGAAYALTSIATAIEEARDQIAFWVEPIVMLAVILAVTVFWN